MFSSSCIFDVTTVLNLFSRLYKLLSQSANLVFLVLFNSSHCFAAAFSRCFAILTVFISQRSSILLSPLPPSLLFPYSLSTSLAAWSAPAIIKSFLVFTSKSLISVFVQSSIAIVGPITGTANELCALVLFLSV